MKTGAKGKNGTNWQNLLYAILLSALCMQIFFAVKWIIGNGWYLQNFMETSEYLKNARALKCNGWTLIGYSLFLRLFLPESAGYVLNNTAIMLLFMIQFVGAFGCFFYLIYDMHSMLGSKNKRIIQSALLSLYICTFPEILQMILAVLPDIWIQIMLSYIFVKGTKLVFRPDLLKWPEVVAAGVVTGLLGMVNREAFYGAVVYTVFIIILAYVRKKKRILTVFLMGSLLAAMLISGIVNNKTIIKADNYMGFSVRTALWFDVAYPNMFQDYEFYSEETRNALLKEEVKILAENKENARCFMETIIMARTGDRNRVKAVYRDMIKVSILHHKKNYLASKGRILMDILFLPVSLFCRTFVRYDMDGIYLVTRMWENDWIGAVQYLRVGGMGALICMLSVIFIGFLTVKPFRKMAFPGMYIILSMFTVAAYGILFGVQNYAYRPEHTVFIFWIFGLAALMDSIPRFRQALPNPPDMES